MRQVCAIAFCCVLVACGNDEPTVAAIETYTIDTGRITVSGVSSGAMMATQLHVAHSRLFGGAGIVAGGPYYCAEASLSKGLGACVNGANLDIAPLIAYVRRAAEDGKVDRIENLADDSVWIFHGAKDDVVHADVTAAAASMYQHLGINKLEQIDDVPAGHGFPTVDTGVSCDELAAPFLNACDFDAAGRILGIVYGELNQRMSAMGELLSVPQPGAGDATMLPEAYLYVPTTCAEGASCGLHVALHGCQQSSAFVGTAFATGAGYNEWAESNDLLVLYPQVDSSKLAPMNPLGCWDWWGYTDDDYATQTGAQIIVIKATMDLLAGLAL